jgi:hypothetical protein
MDVNVDFATHQMPVPFSALTLPVADRHLDRRLGIDLLENSC